MGRPAGCSFGTQNVCQLALLCNLKPAVDEPRADTEPQLETDGGQRLGLKQTEWRRLSGGSISSSSSDGGGACLWWLCAPVESPTGRLAQAECAQPQLDRCLIVGRKLHLEVGWLKWRVCRVFPTLLGRSGAPTQPSWPPVCAIGAAQMRLTSGAPSAANRAPIGRRSGPVDWARPRLIYSVGLPGHAPLDVSAGKWGLVVDARRAEAIEASWASGELGGGGAHAGQQVAVWSWRGEPVEWGEDEAARRRDGMSGRLCLGRVLVNEKESVGLESVWLGARRRRAS